MVNGNMSRSRSLRRLSSMIDLSPSLRSPAILREGLSTSATALKGGREGGWEGRREEHEAGVKVPPLRILQWWWEHAITFYPFLVASPHWRRRSHSVDEVLLRQPPSRFSRKGAVCRCHCSALGEGHYSEQGEPVTSAPTPAIDPTLASSGGQGCNAPDVRCRVLR